ncbi:MAG: DUF362 domain-containing protein [Chitinivibrionales bacterium]|nr:DUF362 domain-containing protein [Chitinivibrionales bacterium]MBD3394976.1 DUF362 domain-containing protein [Chitinivibrionales bacterium]
MRHPPPPGLFQTAFPACRGWHRFAPGARHRHNIRRSVIFPFGSPLKSCVLSAAVSWKIHDGWHVLCIGSVVPVRTVITIFNNAPIAFCAFACHILRKEGVVAASRVAIVSVRDRTAAAFADAIGEGFALLASQGEAHKGAANVLLKVDVRDDGNDRPVVATTPALVEALARRFREAGSTVAIGDTPGGSGYRLWHQIRRLLLGKLRGRIRGKNYDDLMVLYGAVQSLKLFTELDSLDVPDTAKPLVLLDDLGVESQIDFFKGSGIADAADACGATLRRFDLEPFDTVTSPAGTFLASVLLCRAIAEADHILSVARAGISAEGRISGALANMFGVVPTSMRAPYERTARLASASDEMVVDIFAAVSPPPFAVIDAAGIAGREGATDTRNLVIMSPDCVAADTVLAALCHAGPANRPLLDAAEKAGCGCAALDRIEILGEPVGQHGGPR